MTPECIFHMHKGNAKINCYKGKKRKNKGERDIEQYNFGPMSLQMAITHLRHHKLYHYYI